MGCFPASCVTLYTESWPKIFTALSLRSEVSSYRYFCPPGANIFFEPVSVAVMERFIVDSTCERGIQDQVISTLDITVPIVSIVVGSNLLCETYSQDSGSEDQRKLIDFPIFILCLLNRCMQKLSTSVFASLNVFSF